MKKTVYLLALISFVITSCQNQEKKEAEITTDMIQNPNSASDDATEGAYAILEFEEDVIDFGEISQGEKVERVFTFTNTGEVDLIISNASGSCGCTVPNYPKQPVAPGDKGEIKVVFDSNGKHGRQHKTVTLVANTQPNTTVLAIKGDVLTPAQQNEE